MPKSLRAFALFGFPVLAMLGLEACELMKHAQDTELKTDGQVSAFQAVTGSDTEEEQARWDHLFRVGHYGNGTRPDGSLAASLSVLPVGRALVMPMEEGGNAVFLARNGFDVAGIDFSEVALQKARRLAREQKVAVGTINADLKYYEIEPDSYSVIVDLDFHLDRLIPQIKRGLRKGGVVFYKTEVNTNLLAAGALKQYFREFEILSYRQETIEGRPYEVLVARK